MSAVIIAPVIIAVAQEQAEKQYIMGCESLGLDPSKIYEQSVIGQRVLALDCGLDKVQSKFIKKFSKDYQKLASKGFCRWNLANEYAKRIAKGKFKITWQVE